MGEIKVDAGLFEMILNCLANQKFIEERDEEDREAAQAVIDETWNRGMGVLSDYQHGRKDIKMDLKDLNTLADFMTTLDTRLDVKYFQCSDRIRMSQAAREIGLEAKHWDMSPERAVSLAEKLIAVRTSQIDYLREDLLMVEEAVADAEGFIEEVFGTPEAPQEEPEEDLLMAKLPRCHAGEECTLRVGTFPFCDIEVCEARMLYVGYSGVPRRKGEQ